MIFLNRRRTIIENGGSEIVKDPSKYWYVEKYVYGVLKETVEIPLKTSVTFGSISSGYDDDSFYGWSVTSTSTTRTFNHTTSYVNTTTSVKNKLDSNNTLKIYAIFQYPYIGKSFSALKKNASSSVVLVGLVSNKTNILTAKGNGTLTVNTASYGERVVTLVNGATTSDVTTSKSINVKIYAPDGQTLKGTISSNETISVTKGDTIRCYINTIYQTPGGTSGPPSGSYRQIVFINFAFECDVDLSNANIIKSRVESHT